MTAQTVRPPLPPGPAIPAGPSLSPSRAADFKTCPLLFRFRTIDKLPEQPSADQVRGTLVHAVLEALFDLPAAERTPEAAAGLIAPSWARLVEQEPALAELFTTPPATSPTANPTPTDTTPPSRTPQAGGLAAAPAGGLATTAAPAAGLAATPASAGGLAATPAPAEGVAATAATTGGVPAATASAEAAAGPAADDRPAPRLVDPAAAAAEADATGQAALLDVPLPDDAARLAAFLSGARALLDGYFAVEDPRRLEPAERESLISALVDDELLIRGYIDRLDVSAAGDLRVVDYKTGGAPREAFEGRALFQLKFYALVLWRTRGVVPKVLRLLYLKDAEVCDYRPDAEELERFERTLMALSQAIERAKRDQDFRPKPSRLCGWCNHQRFCPEFGGTPPPYPTSPDPTSPTEPADAVDAVRITVVAPDDDRLG